MAVKCKFYQLQSVEESIATTGKDCAVMSKPNANSGYWQMPDEPSHLLCTFITPYGRYCPTTIMFINYLENCENRYCSAFPQAM